MMRGGVVHACPSEAACTLRNFEAGLHWELHSEIEHPQPAQQHRGLAHTVLGKLHVRMAKLLETTHYTWKHKDKRIRNKKNNIDNSSKGDKQ